MSYRYETHLHTCQGSACGVSTGAEHARYYKSAGYQGIFVTDHFFGGNTAVPRELPWRERIHWFCSGFEDAWNEGQKVGLDVFFGWEESFDGDDYLVYGLDKQFMLDHPEMEHWSRKDQYEAVHAAGGCVIQAHPFRMRGYIQAIHLGDRFADGVEIANAGNTPAQDVYAAHYARQHQLYTITGSDNHRSHEDSALYGVALDQPLDSIQDWVQHILTRQPHVLLCPADRWDSPTEAEPLIRTYRMDAANQRVELHGDWRTW
ncbi:MAG: PHP domain-containing protein [Clostridia bacterium]|nr:PHP domain-containing protein [Clostridia bacterium]